MPEARDRREIPVDVDAMFARLRASIYHHGDSGPLTFESTPEPGPTRVGLGTPRNRIGHGGARFPHGSTPGVGNENTPPLGTGSSLRRLGRSVLSSSYPRTPLRDITAVDRGASVLSTPKQVIVKLITDTSEDGSELTPQRKLLNSIDTVEKVVTEELQKLVRTPSAKKGERERRVSTLMTMR